MVYSWEQPTASVIATYESISPYLNTKPTDYLSPEMGESSPTPHILIIEDTQSLLRLYSHVLEQAGYSVIEASTGQAAQATILERRPDIVLLDRVLPDMDGSDLCHWIKATPDLSQTFVIMLSALKTSEDDRVSGLEAGADDYIIKDGNSTAKVLSKIKEYKLIG